MSLFLCDEIKELFSRNPAELYKYTVFWWDKQENITYNGASLVRLFAG
ncbi:hypothetical protein ACFGVR_18215 [Mucilaginibacter sp. AW1-3]